jgi:hypothetical protein
MEWINKKIFLFFFDNFLSNKINYRVYFLKKW